MNTLPEVVGHRGFPSRFPDNTLAGFLAAAVIADAVETDVRRSGDGKLVLAHDPVLDGLVVAESPWSQLGEIDLGDGHRPALLDEALAALPDTPIQLEVKNLPHQPGFEPDHRIGLETAERARPGDVVTSFHPATLAAVRSVFPEVTTGLCLPGFGDLSEAIALCLEHGHQVLVPSVEHDDEMLAAAVRAGLRVYPYTTHHPRRVRELVAVGVSGIIGDDPAAIRAILERGA